MELRLRTQATAACNDHVPSTGESWSLIHWLLLFWERLLLNSLRFLLADRFVAEETIGRTGNLAFQCGPGLNRAIVTDIAVSVIGDLIGQFRWGRLVWVRHSGNRGAVVARLQMACAT